MAEPGVVDIYSVNYDFAPMIPYAAKTMWVQLAFPVRDLQPGAKASIVSTDNHFIPPKEQLTVADVVGTRVSLTTPKDLRAGHWGFATRYFTTPDRQHRNWTYGQGNPIGRLVYEKGYAYGS